MQRSLLAVSVILAACAPAPEAGQGPPLATRVEMLGEGVLSTAANEYNPNLGPDGRTLVFARSEPDFRNARILFSELRGGRWSAPEPAPFTVEGRSDSDPTFAPDGRTLYFASDRPAPGRDPARTDLDLWRVRREGDGWGTPEHLGAVNGPAQELGPAVHDGWLYFGSSRGGRTRMLDVFRARESGAGFGPVEAMEQWNTAASEGDPEISPDGATALFWSDRAGGQGEGDLYVSRRTGDGWSAAAPAAGLNSAGFDFTPDFSSDGRWLYFASTRADSAGSSAVRNGQSNLYRVPASAVLR